MKELNVSSENFELQDIKKNNISEEELDRLKELEGSYESLLNKRARKLKEIDTSSLKDEDYKSLILNEYTFLKRPVILINNKAFIGNSKKVISAAKIALSE